MSGDIFQCQVMPCGITNVLATFQRLMNKVVYGVNHCTIYIDDILVYDTVWEEHVTNIERFQQRLDEAGVMVNVAKYEFVKATMQYLGYVAGHGMV